MKKKDVARYPFLDPIGVKVDFLENQNQQLIGVKFSPTSGKIDNSFVGRFAERLQDVFKKGRVNNAVVFNDALYIYTDRLKLSFFESWIPGYTRGDKGLNKEGRVKYLADMDVPVYQDDPYVSVQELAKYKDGPLGKLAKDFTEEEFDKAVEDRTVDAQNILSLHPVIASSLNLNELESAHLFSRLNLVRKKLEASEFAYDSVVISKVGDTEIFPPFRAIKNLDQLFASSIVKWNSYRALFNAAQIEDDLMEGFFDEDLNKEKAPTEAVVSIQYENPESETDADERVEVVSGEEEQEKTENEVGMEEKKGEVQEVSSNVEGDAMSLIKADQEAKKVNRRVKKLDLDIDEDSGEKSKTKRKFNDVGEYRTGARKEKYAVYESDENEFNTLSATERSEFLKVPSIWPLSPTALKESGEEIDPRVVQLISVIRDNFVNFNKKTARGYSSPFNRSEQFKYASTLKKVRDFFDVKLSAKELKKRIESLSPEQGQEMVSDFRFLSRSYYGYDSFQDYRLKFGEGRWSERSIKTFISSFDADLTEDEREISWAQTVKPSRSKTPAKRGTKLADLRPHLAHIQTDFISSRQDADITENELYADFGFSVQYGTTTGNNNKEAQFVTNAAYDSFDLLAKSLKVGKEDISMGRELAIAFASRGKGNACAHYEPSKKIINLTKLKGAGSLAHEMFHAFDHLFLAYSSEIEGTLNENVLMSQSTTLSKFDEGERTKPEDTGLAVFSRIYRDTVREDRSQEKLNPYEIARKYDFDVSKLIDDGLLVVEKEAKRGLEEGDPSSIGMYFLEYRIGEALEKLSNEEKMQLVSLISIEPQDYAKNLRDRGFTDEEQIRVEVSRLNTSHMERNWYKPKDELRMFLKKTIVEGKIDESALRGLLSEKNDSIEKLDQLKKIIVKPDFFKELLGSEKVEDVTDKTVEGIIEKIRKILPEEYARSSMNSTLESVYRSVVKGFFMSEMKSLISQFLDVTKKADLGTYTFSKFLIGTSKFRFFNPADGQENIHIDLFNQISSSHIDSAIKTTIMSESFGLKEAEDQEKEDFIQDYLAEDLSATRDEALKAYAESKGSQDAGAVIEKAKTLNIAQEVRDASNSAILEIVEEFAQGAPVNQEVLSQAASKTIVAVVGRIAKILPPEVFEKFHFCGTRPDVAPEGKRVIVIAQRPIEESILSSLCMVVNKERLCESYPEMKGLEFIPSIGKSSDEMDRLVSSYANSKGLQIRDQESEFLKDARELNKNGKVYWTKNCEMLARAFEAWIYDKTRAEGNRCDFLVHSVGEGQYSLEKQASPYPKGDERQKINAFLDENVDRLSFSIKAFGARKNPLASIELFSETFKEKVRLEVAQWEKIDDLKTKEPSGPAGP